MLRIAALVFCLLNMITAGWAQQQPDSIRRHVATMKETSQKLDSANNQLNGRIDSIQKKVNAFLTQPWTRLGKKMTVDTIASDSLNSVRKQFDSLKQRLALPLDSLKSLNISSAELQKKLDSMELQLKAPIGKARNKITELEEKLNAPAEVKDAVNERLGVINQASGGALPADVQMELPEVKAPLPGIETKNLSLGQPLDNPLTTDIPGLSDIKTTTGSWQQLPQQQINKIKSADEVSSAQKGLSQANAITDKVQGFGNDVTNISDGNFNQVKELPNTLEQEIMSRDELNGFSEHTGKMKEYTDVLQAAGDSEAIKKEAKQKAMTYATDHFAGKEEVLKQSMEQLSNLKAKYTEVNGLENIPKRKPNEMKGKPLIERLVPALNLQIQRNDNGVLVDFNPAFGYRPYGRLVIGLGWNERITIKKDLSVTFSDRVYGPRVFADFQVGRGWSVRTDIEKLNSYIPPRLNNGRNVADGVRGWVWSAFAGVKKEYQFLKNVKGNIQLLYNFYDDHDNSPYADRFAVRMGFECKLKKGVKRAKTQSLTH